MVETPPAKWYDNDYMTKQLGWAGRTKKGKAKKRVRKDTRGVTVLAAGKRFAPRQASLIRGTPPDSACIRTAG